MTTLQKITSWKQVTPGTKIFTANPKKHYISISGNHCYWYIDNKKCSGDIFLVGEQYLATSNEEYFIEVDETATISSSDAAEISKFEVGHIYGAINQSFKIQITKRTEKTVWFENIVDGVKGEFCSQGKKKVTILYGRESIIDGIYRYTAA